MPKALKTKEIALAVPLAVPHVERIVQGITEYARQHAVNWTFAVDPELASLSVTTVAGWPGDGIFAYINSRRELRIARKLAMPVVNLSGAIHDTGLPRVIVDHAQAGRMAAEHLLGRGFRRFAYYGLQRVWYSQERGRGFIERIRQAGAQCAVFEDTSSINARRAWHHWFEDLRQWMATLETPIGLFAVHDHRAWMVIQVCDRLDLRVPDDVAVIGMDNDEITCEFCKPSLSSVSRSGQKVGYEAAALMDRLLTGRRLPKGDVVIPPDKVVQRASTDVVVVEDANVTTVMRFVQEHFREDFGIDDLVRLVPISRRWLELRFKRCLDRTLYDYVCEVRVQRAKQLLAASNKQPLRQIARACGFRETRRLCRVFERFTGVPPETYRESVGFDDDRRR